MGDLNSRDGGKAGVALVTGGAGDLGRAVVARLARAGFAVAIADLDSAGAEDALRAVRALDGRGLAPCVDVADADSFTACIDRVEGELGPVTLLVNNAGLEGDVAAFSDYSADVFDRVMAVNARGVFLGTKLALSRMMPRGAGCIVNVASTSAIRGRAGLAGYVASKHAVLGLTRVAALDAAGSGVRVNAVLPGPIEGRMIRSLEEKAGGGIARAGRASRAMPEDVASGVAFLASDEARHINGEALVIDGGATVM
ncbi:SDR family oxidoreductase [Marivibrio halodurans]|uniref:SDR family oxidoreductase n=1 Tax=Marivibrio halodurans TaxID=2039722 RepID=A0A8J7S455_9PROT|nr:SDR family NAD(P)-dependent oxidoreductase [Marivibrio halodurans]MBP5858389.1 SDR family oxidoreductase [Marivibrio halodurans]